MEINFNYAQPYFDIQQFVSTIREGEIERVWFGLVWGDIHLKILWKFHQDLTSFGSFREDFEVWIGMVWYGLVWDNIIVL